ncbi:hypothetical protein HELRODRAFT_183395 [Helobdella robusta]|uniref:DDE-1 domain-containing protein n=1 Tax=Helobdella robusta TaxID=6412 RepID=T1FJK3_HELRO|nr:hypothetical protein HELRODRAFT_183395 [Helobdella robusta]ESO11220.1 hypothetical protein HELRODRAFT_183395 [Helobdella robusta]
MLVAMRKAPDDEMSVRAVGRKYNIDQTMRHCYDIVKDTKCSEFCIVKFLESCRVIPWMNPREVPTLAFQFATGNGKTVQRNWKVDDENDKRLIAVYKRHKFGPETIYNIDETGITTVERPSRIVAQKGVKQVGAIVSQKRGQLVILAFALNALGNSISSAFLFPSVHYKDHFVRGGPAHPSGWITEVNIWKLKNIWSNMHIFQLRIQSCCYLTIMSHMYLYLCWTTEKRVEIK